jgi:hypothetical protein
MPYLGLGSRRVVAALDQTGLNPGNLTTAFTPAALNINVPFFELYKMMVETVPIGYAASVVIDTKLFSYTMPLSGSEWDPAQPMLLIPSNELDLLWNIPVANTTIPVCTAWFRFDPTISANAKYGNP